MSRGPIPVTIKTPQGRPIAGASVTIINRATNLNATIYAAETGTATKVNPTMSGPGGAVDGWLEIGRYAALINAAQYNQAYYPFDVRGVEDLTAPTGPAGGALAGTYPNPTFATPVATQADLNAEIAARNAAITAHSNLTTNVHGIPNTQQLNASSLLGNVLNDRTVAYDYGQPAIGTNANAHLLFDFVNYATPGWAAFSRSGMIVSDATNYGFFGSSGFSISPQVSTSPSTVLNVQLGTGFAHQGVEGSGSLYESQFTTQLAAGATQKGAYRASMAGDLATRDATRISIYHNGEIRWSSGQANHDVFLNRFAPGVLAIPQSGGGLRLTSPDGLTSQTLSINNAGVLSPGPDLSTLVTLTPATSNRNVIQPTGVAVTPLVVKGFSGQTADLQQWQNSAGGSVARISAGGDLAVNAHTANASGVIQFNNDLLGNGGPIVVRAANAALIPLVVRGVASQTADLQEWQNSASTTLAMIDASGNFTAKQGDFTAPAVGSSALIVRGASGQTSNIMVVNILDGSTRFSLNSHGGLRAPHFRSGHVDPTTGAGNYGGNLAFGRGLDLSQFSYVLMGTDQGDTAVFSAQSDGNANVGLTFTPKGTGVVTINNANLGGNTVGSRISLANTAGQGGSHLVDLKGAPRLSQSVTNKALTSNVATLTAGGEHGFRAGTYVSVSGVGAPFDGLFLLTAVTGPGGGNTFSYRVTGANVTSQTATGTAFSNDQGISMTRWTDGAGYLAADVSFNGASRFNGFFDPTSVAAGVYSGQNIDSQPQIAFANGTAAQNALLTNQAGILRSSSPGGQSVIHTGTTGPVSTFQFTNAGFTGSLIRGIRQDGIEMFSINSVGRLSVSSAAISDSITMGNNKAISSLSNAFRFDSNSSLTFIIEPNLVETTGPPMRVRSDIPGTVSLVVRGAASQTADLQQWQNSAGTVLSRVNSSGSIGVGTAPATANDSFESLLNSTGFVVRHGSFSGATDLVVPSDSGGLRFFTNSNRNYDPSSPAFQMFGKSFGSSLSGQIYFDSGTVAGSGTYFRYGPTQRLLIDVTASTFTPQSASSVPLVSKGAASQTANLQEWQSSAGTVLTFINAGGNLFALAPPTGKTYRPLLNHDVTNTIWDIDYNGLEGATAADSGYRMRFGQNAISFFTRNQTSGTLDNRFTIGQRTQGISVNSYLVMRNGASDGASNLVLQAFSDDGLNQQMRVQNFKVGLGKLPNGYTADTAALYVESGTASDAVIRARAATAQTGNLQEWQSSTPATLASITAAGLHKWDAAANQQTTVGAAGGASALPATPTKYLRVVDSTGATLVIPAYAAA